MKLTGSAYWRSRLMWAESRVREACAELGELQSTHMVSWGRTDHDHQG